VLGPAGCERLDLHSTTGIAVCPAGVALVRQPLPYGGPAPCELVVVEPDGAVRRRVDATFADGHDVLAVDGGWAVACTLANRVQLVDHDLVDLGAWHADGDGDAWHLNGLADLEGSLHVTAFGRHREHRAWAEERGTGLLIRADDDHDVAAGLDKPHSPRPVDRGWLVCDSGRARVVLLDEGGVTASSPTLGFTRGVAVGDDAVYVGVSEPRGFGFGGGDPWVAVLDRATLQLRARWPVPGAEIYEVAIVSPDEADGLRRLGAEDPGTWTASPPLDEPVHGEVAVTTAVPTTLVAGRGIVVHVEVENRTDRPLSGVGRHPIVVGIRWDRTGAVRPTRLPVPVGPGERRTVPVWLAAPTVPGPQDVEVLAYQHDVRWFDAGASVAHVDVLEPPPASGRPRIRFA
jgi:hypothetical protein